MVEDNWSCDRFHYYNIIIIMNRFKFISTATKVFLDAYIRSEELFVYVRYVALFNPVQIQV